MDAGPRMMERWRIPASVLGLAFIVALLALLPLPMAALLLAAVVVAVLVLIDPVWGLYLAVLSVPVQEIVLLPGGLNVTQAAVMLGAGSWGLRALAYPERSLRAGRLGPGFAALLWALALATLTTPYSQVEGVKETLRWVMAALVYLLALNLLRATEAGPNGWGWRAKGLLVCLLVAPSVNAVIGLWQFATATGPASFVIADGRFVRAYGTIGQPNSFAGSLNMAWPLAVALFGWALLAWRCSPKPGARHSVTLALLGVCAMLLLAALVATFSRGGWVGALAGTGAMLVATTVLIAPAVRRQVWRALAVAAAAALIVLVLGGGGLLPDAVEQRLVSITRSLRLFDVRGVAVTPENFAVVERMAHLQAAWGMFTYSPLTGIGPGSYTPAYEGHAAETFIPPFTVHPWYLSRGHAHNYYLHIAAEAGVVGLATYVLLLALLFGQMRATLRCVEGWYWRSVVIGSCGIIVAVVMHNLFENLHVLNLGIQLSAVWGLLGAMEDNCGGRPTW